jgi:hypothetical protein
MNKAPFPIQDIDGYLVENSMLDFDIIFQKATHSLLARPSDADDSYWSDKLPGLQFI